MLSSQLSKARSLYASGLSAEKISKIIGVNPCTIRYHLRKEGLMRGIRDAQLVNSPVDRETEKRMIDLYLQGFGSVSIGKLLGVTPPTILSRVSRFGINRSQSEANHMRSLVHVNEERLAKRILLFDLVTKCGMSSKEIAQLLGEPWNSVRSAIFRTGIRFSKLSINPIEIGNETQRMLRAQELVAKHRKRFPRKKT